MKPWKIPYSIFIYLVVIMCCSRNLVSNKVVVPTKPYPSSKDTEKRYMEIKSRWTVVLGSRRPNRPSGLVAPAFATGSGPSREAGFPITVSATLMDRQVIEAGLHYYAEMISMSPDEIENFRKRYWDIYEPDKSILIEASLQTTEAENYLDLSRWTIFLEDDQGNQIGLSKISENPLSSTHFSNRINSPEFERPFFMDFSYHAKNVLLYFPRIDYYGNPSIHEDVKYLKIVFLLDVGGHARAEGSWLFSTNK
jgi:hypothetical protein